MENTKVDLQHLEDHLNKLEGAMHLGFIAGGMMALGFFNASHSWWFIGAAWFFIFSMFAIKPLNMKRPRFLKYKESSSKEEKAEVEILQK